MKFIKTLNTQNILLVFFSILSFCAWYISHITGLTLSYNDAMSHLNISRLVIDNQSPGLSQIGSVWLPLSHLLPILFVWSDFLWKTGLAGSVFSMISYIASCFFVYKTVEVLTKNKIAAVLGAFAMGLNLNFLYLQTTPLTEALYIFFFALTTYFFAIWLTNKKNDKYLLVLGILGFFQVLTRYDGWFVTFFLFLLIGYTELFVHKQKLSHTIGRLILYGLPIGFGVSLWIIWNLLIFSDPFYFALGEYSARAQQDLIEHNSGLIAKGDFITSVLAYWYTIYHVIGSWVLSFSALGISVFLLLIKKVINFPKKIVFLAFLISPAIFNILALFMGFSIVNVPELQWNPSGSQSGNWFNVRYGIFTLPFAAIAIGFFSSWKKYAAILAVLILIVQGLVTYSQGIAIITDGTKGASAFTRYGISVKLRLLVEDKDTVLMSMSHFNPVAFRSNLQLKQIVHEGVSDKWDNALVNPSEYADWIVVGTENNPDLLYNAFLVSQNSDFISNYQKEYEDHDAILYKRILKETQKNEN